MDRVGRGEERRGGVFTGRRPGDKGRVKIKMNCNNKKKPSVIFLLMSNNVRGRVGSCASPCLCGKRREQDLGITSWPIRQRSNVRGEDARRMLCPIRVAVTATD